MSSSCQEISITAFDFQTNSRSLLSYPCPGVVVCTVSVVSYQIRTGKLCTTGRFQVRYPYGRYCGRPDDGTVRKFRPTQSGVYKGPDRQKTMPRPSGLVSAPSFCQEPAGPLTKVWFMDHGAANADDEHLIVFKASGRRFVINTRSTELSSEGSEVSDPAGQVQYNPIDKSGIGINEALDLSRSMIGQHERKPSIPYRMSQTVTGTTESYEYLQAPNAGKVAGGTLLGRLGSKRYPILLNSGVNVDDGGLVQVVKTEQNARKSRLMAQSTHYSLTHARSMRDFGRQSALQNDVITVCQFQDPQFQYTAKPLIIDNDRGEI